MDVFGTQCRWIYTALYYKLFISKALGNIFTAASESIWWETQKHCEFISDRDCSHVCQIIKRRINESIEWCSEWTTRTQYARRVGQRADETQDWFREASWWHHGAQVLVLRSHTRPSRKSVPAIITQQYKKLIRRWDSERELSLLRYCHHYTAVKCNVIRPIQRIRWHFTAQHGLLI